MAALYSCAMSEAPFVFLIAVFFIIVLAIGLGLAAYLIERRREALFLLAQRLELSFTPQHDSQLAAQYAFLKGLNSGENRYCFNTLAGRFHGEEIMASDFHYETHSSSKGRRRTRHHYLSLYTLRLPVFCPELTISKEGWLSKIAQAFGYEDIDFESHEFSRAFCVRSRDKKFAYAVCHPRMMEYLLEHRDLAMEIEHNTLALVFPFKLKPAGVEFNLGRLLEIRSRLPRYLFS